MKRDRHRASPACRPAFTVAEAAVVSAIIAILGAIVLPRYGAFIASRQTESAARRVLSDLIYAQRQARITSTTQRVVFDVVHGTYQLLDMSDPNRKNQVYTVDLTQDPYRANIYSAAFGGDSTVIFDGYGVPDTVGTLTVKVGKYRQTISVEGGLSRPRITSAVSVVEAM